MKNKKIVSKKQCKAIAVRPQPEIYSELKKEAEEKGLTLAKHCEDIINNRHNIINNHDNNEDKLYKVTVVKFYKKSIKDIEKEFKREHDEIFDGQGGYIDSKLISIEEVK